MSTNLGQLLLTEMLLLLQPIVTAANSKVYRAKLLEQLGYQLEELAGVDEIVIDSFQGVIATYEALKPLVQNPPDSLDELKAALEKVAGMVQKLKALQRLAEKLAVLQVALPELDTIVERLVDHLTLSYLYTQHPVLYRVLQTLTLIDEAPTPTAGQTFSVMTADGATLFVPTAHEEIRWSQIPGLLSDPVRFFREELLQGHDLSTPASARALSDRLFPRVAALLTEMGIKAVYGHRPEEHPDSGAAGNDMAAGGLAIVFRPPVGEEGPVFGLTLFLSPAERGNLGLVVIPSVGGSGTLQFDEWALKIELNVDGVIPPFAVGPGGLVIEPASLSRIAGKISLVKGTEGNSAPLAIGSTSGTRLEVGDVSLALPFDLSPASQDFGLELNLKQAAIVVAAAEGDGFLKQILPKDGLRADFELTAGWTHKRGFYIGGGAGFDATIPIHKTVLGAIDIDSVFLGIRGDTKDKAIHAYAATSAALKLGPVTAVVEKAGVEAKVTFPVGGGNLGPAHVELGFKPPEGVGLTLDAGQVTGGGYLFYDKANQQYAGVLQLELAGGISVKAIGLLTTKMPDGSSGFSLLILVTADGFAPLQLGMGFSITGVGGLVGVNRSAAVDVLRAGLRNRTLNSVLSPKDPIKNASRIVSDLKSVFPPAKDQFLFGPMVTIAWGAGNMVTFNLALILELPKPARLLMLGQVKALLPVPDDAKALVRLQMDALGAVEFTQGTASLDAVLYDSRIGPFTLTGAMALRARWSDNPTFILSVGGFNPRFKAPEGFPKLERLAISLAKSDDLMIRLEAYMAITSNTVQFGAKLQVHAEAMGFALDGFLGFDALFQFSPFQFVTDIGGGLALRRGSKVLMQLMVAVMLSGPNPFHVRGKATFEILFFKATISFDKTMGSNKSLPAIKAVNAREKLLEAISDAHNWQTQVPAGEQALVTLRKVTVTTGLLGHPLGSLTFSQKVVPLGEELEMLGGAPVESGTALAITAAAVNGTTVAIGASTYEAFAPAQYFRLTDDAKLTSPSFRQMKSGVQVNQPAPQFDLGQGTAMDYRRIVIDLVMGQEGELTEPLIIPAQVAQELASVSALAQAPARRVGNFRYRTVGAAVSVAE